MTATIHESIIFLYRYLNHGSQGLFIKAFHTLVQHIDKFVQEPCFTGLT